MLCELMAGHPDFRSLATIAGISVDLRYASANNFVGRDLYGQLDCRWLHRQAAAGLETVVLRLQRQDPGCSLLLLDALRPHRVQETLWQCLAGTQLQQYLADPAKGSIHSFGMAVDVTLVDQAGVELDMGTGFDDLSDLSHPKFEPRHLAQGLLSQTQIRNRQVLREAMLSAGFSAISTEWWHFDFGDRALVRRDYLRIE
ncbi:MAG: M15 family metallopeptidase [Comamonadaceae bacterium]|jgi:zinc D-Ala-D-Ala dipeptidase